MEQWKCTFSICYVHQLQKQNVSQDLRVLAGLDKGARERSFVAPSQTQHLCQLHSPVHCFQRRFGPLSTLKSFHQCWSGSHASKLAGNSGNQCSATPLADLDGSGWSSTLHKWESSAWCRPILRKFTTIGSYLQRTLYLRFDGVMLVSYKDDLFFVAILHNQFVPGFLMILISCGIQSIPSSKLSTSNKSSCRT